jgi:hypothetical protein
LQRSVRLKHGKLALIRLIQAERIGLQIDPSIRLYREGVAKRFTVAALVDLIRRAAPGTAEH